MRVSRHAHFLLALSLPLMSSALRQIRDSIVVSISACHAEDPGSIPGRGVCTCSRISRKSELDGVAAAAFFGVIFGDFYMAKEREFWTWPRPA